MHPVGRLRLKDPVSVVAEGRAPAGAAVAWPAPSSRDRALRHASIPTPRQPVTKFSSFGADCFGDSSGPEAGAPVTARSGCFGVRARACAKKSAENVVHLAIFGRGRHDEVGWHEDPVAADDTGYRAQHN